MYSNENAPEVLTSRECKNIFWHFSSQFSTIVSVDQKNSQQQIIFLTMFHILTLFGTVSEQVLSVRRRRLPAVCVDFLEDGKSRFWEVRKSRSLESQNPEMWNLKTTNITILKIEIHVAQNVGKVSSVVQ